MMGVRVALYSGGRHILYDKISDEELNALSRCLICLNVSLSDSLVSSVSLITRAARYAIQNASTQTYLAGKEL